MSFHPSYSHPFVPDSKTCCKWPETVCPAIPVSALLDRRDSKPSPPYRSSPRSMLISKQVYLSICCLASLPARPFPPQPRQGRARQGRAGQHNVFAQIHAQPSAVQMPDQRISKLPAPNVNVSQPQCYFIFTRVAVPCRPNHDTMKEQ